MSFLVHNLSVNNSIISEYLYDLREKERQKERWLFRKNMERIGAFMGYEISKSLSYESRQVQTPLGVAEAARLQDEVVLGAIMRAALPVHAGLLHVFDKADSLFVGSYRTQIRPDGNMGIAVDYMSGPSLAQSIFILSDPMLATGNSMVACLDELIALKGTPKQIHLVSVVASEEGIRRIHSSYPQAVIWCAAIDACLNDKKYIIPGLGDAGDLAYGARV